MRIYELVDGIPVTAAYVYICHAPDGDCRVLGQDGNVYDRPLLEPQFIAPAISKLFDPHWRGANATEVSTHEWPKVRQEGQTFLLGAGDVGILTADEARILAGDPIGRRAGEQPEVAG